MRYYSHIRIEAKREAVNRLVTPPQKPAKVQTSKKSALPRLGILRETALRLGIAPDAALELVLEYERSKSLAVDGAN
jgi:hypothetical protein